MNGNDQIPTIAFQNTTTVKQEPASVAPLVCQQPEAPFGSCPFRPDELERISGQLLEDTTSRDVKTRPGPGGRQLTYMEGWRAIDVANRIFGFNGWSSEIRALRINFCKQPNPDAKRWNACVSCTVRITLKDGSFHEDRGNGSAEQQRTESDALMLAEKEAVTDANKRALKNFGRRLGLSLYSNEHLRQLSSGGTKSRATQHHGSSARTAGQGRIPSAKPGPTAQKMHSTSKSVQCSTERPALQPVQQNLVNAQRSIGQQEQSAQHSHIETGLVAPNGAPADENILPRQPSGVPTDPGRSASGPPVPETDRDRIRAARVEKAQRLQQRAKQERLRSGQGVANVPKQPQDVQHVQVQRQLGHALPGQSHSREPAAQETDGSDALLAQEVHFMSAKKLSSAAPEQPVGRFAEAAGSAGAGVNGNLVQPAPVSGPRFAVAAGHAGDAKTPPVRAQIKAEQERETFAGPGVRQAPLSVGGRVPNDSFVIDKGTHGAGMFASEFVTGRNPGISPVTPASATNRRSLPNIGTPVQRASMAQSSMHMARQPSEVVGHKRPPLANAPGPQGYAKIPRRADGAVPQSPGAPVAPANGRPTIAIAEVTTGDLHELMESYIDDS